MSCSPEDNVLYRSDCKCALDALYREGIRADLIYLDPPFNSNRVYSMMFRSKEMNAQQMAFNDMWHFSGKAEQLYFAFQIELDKAGLPSAFKAFMKAWIDILKNSNTEDQKLLNYLMYMTERLIRMKKILKASGSIYFHCDPRVSHYIKVIIDGIFGRENFINEIIWHYRTYQGKIENYYPKKHDIIFWYAKSEKERSRNNSFVLEYQDGYTDTVDYKRWKKYYVNGNQIRYGQHPKTDSRFTAYLNRWISENKRQPQAGEVIYTRTGYVVDDVWSDIQALDPKDTKERLGYPTQKPLALLDRIIKSSCPQGD